MNHPKATPITIWTNKLFIPILNNRILTTDATGSWIKYIGNDIGPYFTK